MNILIVGGGLQALSVARSLKKERYSVIALLHRGDISTKSKYIDKLYTIDITPTHKDALHPGARAGADVCRPKFLTGT